VKQILCIKLVKYWDKCSLVLPYIIKWLCCITSYYEYHMLVGQSKRIEITWEKIIDMGIILKWISKWGVIECNRVNWLRIMCYIHNNETKVPVNSFEFRKGLGHDQFFQSLLRWVCHLHTELVTILPRRYFSSICALISCIVLKHSSIALHSVLVHLKNAAGRNNREHIE